ncbi:hypothetical protein D3C81_1978630 [compost metagenome]
MVAGKEETQYRHGQDADQHCTADFEAVQRDNHDEADDGEHSRRLMQVTEGNQRVWVAHHDAGIFQCDQAEEQADTGGYRRSQ